MVDLFAFPFAGGSGDYFLKFASNLSPTINLVPIELAGRGKRFRDPVYSTFDEMMQDVSEQVEKQKKHARSAFWGHSMGAMIGYELAKMLSNSGKTVPEVLFLSGRPAPDIAHNNPTRYHQLGDEEFKTVIKEMGGTPPDFFDYPELVELFLPVLKNDFRMSETQPFTEPIQPLNIPFVVMYGLKDKHAGDQMNAWSTFSSASCSYHPFEGGHFFLSEQIPEIANLINLNL